MINRKQNDRNKSQCNKEAKLSTLKKLLESTLTCNMPAFLLILEQARHVLVSGTFILFAHSAWNSLS